jgi:hypothetical protein
MANEFELLPNPDNIPREASSGYKRQNTNMLAIQIGLDANCFFLDGTGHIILKGGGLLEYNGLLYKNSTDIDLTAGIQNILTSSTYCYIQFDGSAVQATSNNGILDQSKFARYNGPARLFNVAFKYFSGTSIIAGKYEPNINKYYFPDGTI